MRRAQHLCLCWSDIYDCRKNREVGSLEGLTVYDHLTLFIILCGITMFRRTRLRAGSAPFCPYITPLNFGAQRHHRCPFTQVVPKYLYIVGTSKTLCWFQIISALFRRIILLTGRCRVSARQPRSFSYGKRTQNHVGHTVALRVPARFADPGVAQTRFAQTIRDFSPESAALLGHTTRPGEPTENRSPLIFEDQRTESTPKQGHSTPLFQFTLPHHRARSLRHEPLQ